MNAGEVIGDTRRRLSVDAGLTCEFLPASHRVKNLSDNSSVAWDPELVSKSIQVVDLDCVSFALNAHLIRASPLPRRVVRVSDVIGRCKLPPTVLEVTHNRRTGRSDKVSELHRRDVVIL